MDDEIEEKAPERRMERATSVVITSIDDDDEVVEKSLPGEEDTESEVRAVEKILHVTRDSYAQAVEAARKAKFTTETKKKKKKKPSAAASGVSKSSSIVPEAAGGGPNSSAASSPASSHKPIPLSRSTEGARGGGTARGGGDEKDKDKGAVPSGVLSDSESSDDGEELLLPEEVEHQEEAEVQMQEDEINQAYMAFTKSLNEDKEAVKTQLKTVLQIIRSYPRFRVANRRLNDEGVDLLRAVGFVERAGYLVNEESRKRMVQRNREWLEDRLHMLEGTFNVAKAVRMAPENLVVRSTRYPAAYADTKGRRETMEDAVVLLGGMGKSIADEDYFAVFDGHGGREAAVYASVHLQQFLMRYLAEGIDPIESLRRSFRDTSDSMIRDQLTAGTTALVAFFYRSRLYVANCGDSRALLCKGHRGVRITIDHKPNNPVEKKRIQRLGGKVTHTWWFSKSYRVNGVLAVSRALGDPEFQQFILPEPDIFELSGRLAEADFLILACDGLWDVISDERAIKIVAATADPATAAKLLRDYAFKKGSTDNISVVVIRMKND